MNVRVTTLDNCLACGGNRLRKYLDLGSQPLANNFSHSAIGMEEFPLAVNLCVTCFHSQLSVSIEPSKLFENYLYVSGTTNTLKEYFDWLNEKIYLKHGPGSRILDLASNDGSFLEISKRKGFKVLGIDPASNLVGLASQRGIPTICDYWPNESLDFLASAFDAIVAMNVLAHVPNPLDFLKSAKKSLKEGGLIYIQTSQARMFSNGEFDTIYHEHLSFFTARSMRILAERAGLVIIQSQYVPVHGTSYLWTLAPSNGSKNSLGKNSEIESGEAKEGIYSEETFDRFAATARQVAARASAKVSEFRNLGFQIWGYGAAAKGNTFLNFSGIQLDGIVDDNPLKQGLVSPGGKTMVYGVSKIAELEDKVLFVIPAWNFKDEIIRRINAIKRFNEAFTLVYFPEMKVSRLC